MPDPDQQGDAALRYLTLAEEACSDLPSSVDTPGRLTLAHAERLVFMERFSEVPVLLEGLLRRTDEWGRTDDRWRALWLLANALRAGQRYGEAAEHFDAIACLCACHDAPHDEAEARVAQGRALFGAGRPGAGMEMIRAARAGLEDSSPAFAGTVAAELAATMTSGDLDAVARLARARALDAVERGEGRVYLALLEVVVHIYRARRRYELAYRLLLTVYGSLSRASTPERAQPILALLDILRRDLGEADFEALSARILAAAR